MEQNSAAHAILEVKVNALNGSFIYDYECNGLRSSHTTPRVLNICDRPAFITSTVKEKRLWFVLFVCRFLAFFVAVVVFLFFFYSALETKKPKKNWPAKLLYLLTPSPFTPLLPIVAKHRDKRESLRQQTQTGKSFTKNIHKYI